MAKGSAKRIHASNQVILKRILTFVVLTLAIGLLGGSWRYGFSSLWAVVGTGVLSLLGYWQLRSLGASQLSGEGRLERSGYDLDAPGLHQYIMDYNYITGAVHTLLPLTRRAWLLYLLIPVYCLYLLLKHLRQSP